MVENRASANAFSIRPAAAGDIEELAVIVDAYRVFYACASSPEATRRYVTERIERPSTRFFVAEEERTIVGFAHLMPMYLTTQLRDMWILEDLFVDASKRARGIGGALLAYIEAFARNSGASRVSLTTAHTNHTAQRLYEAHGYRVDDVFRTYHLALT